MMNLPLTVTWDVDPVMFTIFGIDIRYYGLAWAVAILLGAKFFDICCKREGLPQSVSESVFLYGTIATVLGSRLGHCLFYDPAYYLSNPLTIITGFRDGGMASHGAAVGLLIGLWLFARKNKVPYIWALDRIMVGVTIGGAIVRLGNLINAEIYGTVTDLPWGFDFVRHLSNGTTIHTGFVHPTQIYEALCYLITFVILIVLYFKKDMARRRPGVMFGIGLIGIFVTRFFIEFIKADQEDFEAGMMLNMGQWLSVPFVLLAGWIIWQSFKRPAVELHTPKTNESSVHKHKVHSFKKH